MWDFDDARLEDPSIIAEHDEVLRHLAGAGARIRTEANDVRLPPYEPGMRPRGIVAVGREARLIRAVLEPTSPAPFMAWPFAGLPAWVGPLDLVVVLASGEQDEALLKTVDEATRRGAMMIVTAEAGSPVAEHAASSSTLLVPTKTGDALASAIVVLSVLHELGLGPEVHTESAAEAADLVAEASSPYVSLANNPAKELALGLADAEPLIWGGSVLAGRASRRIAEAIRRNCGRTALAADADELVVLIEGTERRDLFDDPFERSLGAEPTRRPTLIVLDDGDRSDEIVAQRNRLVTAAAAHDVRVCEITSDEITQGNAIDRYVSLMQQGLYGAAYLGIGLGRAPQ